MKKIFLFVLLIAGIAFSSDAQKTRYYYYPSANVYYDIANKQYIYSNNGTWTTVSTLPTGVVVNNKPRVIMYDQNTEVWQNNQAHITKYKAKKITPAPKGKAIGYKGTNPNRPAIKSKPMVRNKIKKN